jgi:hypothetical protein
MNNTPTPRTDEFSKTAYDTDIDDYVAYNKAVAFAQNLERELTAALEASTQWEAEAWRSDELLEQRNNELTEAREELKAVTEQRDRLAEALKYQKELNEWIENTNPEDPFFDEGLRLGLNHASDLATEALAAVKGGSDES